MHRHHSGILAGLLTAAASIVGPGGAAMGQLSSYYGPFFHPTNGKTYYCDTVQRDYDTASYYAAVYGGHLAVPRNAEEARWLDYTFGAYGTAPGDYRWLGMHTYVSQCADFNCWETYDGQRLPYGTLANQGWGAGEPQFHNGVPRAAVMPPGPGNGWSAVEIFMNPSVAPYGYGVMEFDDCRRTGYPDSSQYYGLRVTWQTSSSSWSHNDTAVNRRWRWARNWPAVAGQNDPWEAHWSGFLRTDKTENFTIYLTASSGAELRLRTPSWGEVATYSNWQYTPSTFQKTVALTAGVRYMIAVDFKAPKPADQPLPWIQLEWASPSVMRQVIPRKNFLRPDYSHIDCNNNWVPDECDLSTGASQDCNGNGRPDECDLGNNDCNANGIPDTCDITSGRSKDCNSNWKPDECELGGNDCNNNGIPDACDIASGVEADCNTNGRPDRCDVAYGYAQCPVSAANACLLDNPAGRADCNGNNVADLCDIQAGTSADLNANLVPDDCEPDCNGNGIPDDMDLASGVMQDCDGNGKADACEIPVAEGGFCTAAACPGTDCNHNGVLDACDLNAGIEQDCNRTGTPDSCDIRDARSEDCNRNGTPDECELGGQDCNQNGIPDACDVGSGELQDCNEDGLPDLCETTLVMEEVSGAASSNLFKANREQTTYQNMFAAYGRPWQPGHQQKPGLLITDDPASKLRALFTLRTCDTTLDNVLPVMPELFAFEMALGNEAFSDALDPTIGLSGISPADLGDKFAFQGVAGVSTLLEEELILLRGRALPGSPTDWLNDSVHYPAFSNGTQMVRAAVYNRLPPNAGAGSDSLAYLSNYGPGINNNYDAALRYPQGHGDAFGYYLSATKVYLATFRGNPDDAAHSESLLAQQLIASQSTDNEPVSSPALGDVSLPYQSVRQMAAAMAARARTAVRIVERTYRRDFREDSEDPAVAQLLGDSEPERAWSMGDWARRGAIGAYVDWAISNQLVPPAAPASGLVTPELTQVDRNAVSELSELAAAVGDMQGTLDRAGAGLSPLGLVPNVVPFGINAAELGTGSGRSHYEQVRDAALNALQNAREVLGYANLGSQRLREQAESQQNFAAQLEDAEADFTNRLIEIFGYASRTDPADNDWDPSTTTIEEADGPDLVNFLTTDDRLTALSWEPRKAPGEIQLAISDVIIAGKRLEEAQNAVINHTAEVEELQEFRRFLAKVGEDVEGIYDQFDKKVGTIQAETLDRANFLVIPMKAAVRSMRVVTTIANNTFSGAGAMPDAGKPAGAALGALNGCLQAASDVLDGFRSDIEADANSAYAQQIMKLNVWKDVQLKRTDADIKQQEQFLRLQSLVRQTPQLILNAQTAQENLHQAMGRLNATMQRGQRLVAERERIRKLRRDQLQEHRWKDLAYRTFRNNALQKYDAFFDLAARYVMLAGRAYAYEYNSREQAYLILDKVTRERRLGNAAGSSGGLQAVITDLNNLAQVNKFNTPLTSIGQRSFSLRTNMLGLAPGAEGDRRFRAFLENRIVQNLQEQDVMRDFAQMSVAAHYGPAIVIPFFTEVAGNNFFGNGPDVPFGGTSFPVSLNTKIRNFAVRLVGADPDALGIDRDNAYLSVFLMPIGQSVLRENTNAPTVEQNEPRAWAVVDQWLPAPPLVSVQNPAVQDRGFSPWVSTAGSGGNYLNAIKRFRETEAQIDIGQPIDFRAELAGRSVWNTQWFLVIPGKQWTANASPQVIRERLMALIHGPSGDPAAGAGMTDIRIIIQAYAN